MVGFVETQLRSSAAPEDARDSALRLADAGRPETEHGPGQHIDIHSHLHQILNTIAPLQVDVLIQGETGTGKDTLARRLYQLSGCRGPMVPVNCAAIPETLAESELFGVMTGAFTGASASRAGYIETANDGLLFLDEIDSMPPATQAKLLRALQDRVIERLGSNRSIPVDLRPIAASKVDLREAMSTGRFRPDLYYRLSVVELTIPPLRERIEDIPLLFEYFTASAMAAHGRDPGPIPSATMNLLMTHSWPGNVRELRNAAERYALGLTEPLIAGLPDAGDGRSLAQQVEVFERALIERCLVESGGRISTVLDRLDIPRRTLSEKMVRLGIDRRRFRTHDGQNPADDSTTVGGKLPVR